jgi:hypothetical protein
MGIVEFWFTQQVWVGPVGVVSGHVHESVPEGCGCVLGKIQLSEFYNYLS